MTISCWLPRPFDPTCGCAGTGYFQPTRDATYVCPTHNPETYARMDANGDHHFGGDSHPQALALTPNMECVWVDELMVPILEAAWRDGHMTYNSCQGDDQLDIGYIMFEHRPYTEDFVKHFIANELREVRINAYWGEYQGQREYVDLFYWDGEVRLND